MLMVNNNPLLRFFDRLSPKLFFGLLAVYQFIFIFQGLDFADEGFHATFYQRIFDDPSVVQYNFMYWFSGIVGGIWLKLFSFLGLFGIRLAGVLVVTLTIVLCYNFLKKYLNPGYLKLGLLLVTLFESNDPKEVYYNNLSALFYVMTVFFLFEGLKKNSLAKIFISGSVIAFNVFTRLPNLLETGLITAIFYYGYLNKTRLITVVKQSLSFITGFVFATLLIIGLMKLLGHWDLFLSSLGQLVNLGKSKESTDVLKSQDVSDYYGMSAQIKMFFHTYSRAIRYVVVTFAVLLFTLTIEPLLTERLKIPKWLIAVVKYLLIIVLAVVVLSGSKLNNTPNTVVLYFFSGLVVLITLFILITGENNDLKLLAFAGCFITLSYPVGSSSGVLTAGIYSFWISIPVVVHQLFEIRRVSLTGKWQYSGARDQNIILSINEDAFSRVKEWGVYLCILGCLYSAYYYPMCNSSERTSMRYSVNNKHLYGIYTNKERADVVNELLRETGKYMKPGDYVLAYDAIPMFHYITETKPFMYNSYPWLYQANLFKEQLYKSLDEKKKLPVVVMQKVATNGRLGRRWPENQPEEYEAWNQERNKTMNDFLLSNHYRQVWENRAFTILIP